MLNKKTILIAIVAVAFILLLLVSLKKNGQQTNNGPIRTGQLTREKAAAIILEEIKKNPIKTTADYNQGSGPGGYYVSSMTLEQEGIKKLAQSGFVRILGRSFGVSIFEFTEKSAAYLLPSITANFNPKSKDILLATPASVEVTGLTTSAENAGQKTIVADFTIKCDLSPFGESSQAVKNGLTGYKNQATFILYDDGWRVNPLPYYFLTF